MEHGFQAQATRRRTLRRACIRILVLAPLMVGVALLCLDALHPEIGMPLQLNYVEGFNVDDAARIVRGQPLYGDPTHAPFVITVYTPGYPVLVAALMKLGIPGLPAGRLLTFLCTFAIACAAAGAGYKHTGWVALAAAALFLTDPLLPFWQVVARPDATATLFAITGIMVIETSTTRRRDALAACLLAASFLTKQSFVAAPIAALLVLLRQDRKRAARFALLLTGLCLLSALVLQWASHGQFLWQIVVGNQNPFSWGRVVGLGGQFWSRHIPHLCLLVALFLAGWKARPRSATALWAAIASVLGTIALGKTGSDLNYLVEASAAIALLTARELPLRWLSGRARTARFAAAALVLAAVAVAATSIIEIITDRRPLAAAQGPYKELMARVAHEPGIVVSDDASLLVAAGKPVHIQPFVMAQLAESGRWDQRPFLAELRTQKVRLMVVQTGPSSTFISRYTPEMRRLMAQHYTIAARYFFAGEFALLVPNDIR